MSETQRVNDNRRRDPDKATTYDAYLHLNDPEVDYATFKRVAKTLNELIMLSAVETGYWYLVPGTLGMIYVMRRKSGRKKMIDFQHYIKTGEKIIHKNLHSGGYYARWHWDKSYPYGNFKFKELYKFLPTRENKRVLSKGIKEDGTITKYFLNE